MPATKTPLQYQTFYANDGNIQTVCNELNNNHWSLLSSIYNYKDGTYTLSCVKEIHIEDEILSEVFQSDSAGGSHIGTYPLPNVSESTKL